MKAAFLAIAVTLPAVLVGASPAVANSVSDQYVEAVPNGGGQTSAPAGGGESGEGAEATGGPSGPSEALRPLAESGPLGAEAAAVLDRDRPRSRSDASGAKANSSTRVTLDSRSGRAGLGGSVIALTGAGGSAQSLVLVALLLGALGAGWLLSRRRRQGPSR